jgi:hypothetical protein
MKTLDEIERAAQLLSPAQKTELMLYLARLLRNEQAPLPEPRVFSRNDLDGWMREDKESMQRFLDEQ